MLDLNMIRNKQFKFDISNFNVRDLVSEIKILFEIQCAAKNLKLNLEIKDSVPEIIKTDRNRLM